MAIIPKMKVTAFRAGLAMGLGAALVQAYFQVIPPQAYGMCMVCHPKDLINWIFSHLLGTRWGVTTVSTSVPILTVVGILLGAFIAARRHGEFKLELPRKAIFVFILGFLVINFGLILGSCPIRIIIVSSYGNLIAIVGFICMVVGVVLGSTVMRWNARRSIRQRASR